MQCSGHSEVTVYVCMYVCMYVCTNIWEYNSAWLTITRAPLLSVTYMHTHAYTVAPIHNCLLYLRCLQLRGIFVIRGSSESGLHGASTEICSKTYTYMCT